MTGLALRRADMAARQQLPDASAVAGRRLQATDEME